MNSSYYSSDELQKMGFCQVGHDVNISRKASIYGEENIQIGNHVRVDDFCVLSGKIIIGDYVHIAVSSVLFGGNSGIILSDYCNISSRVAIYAVSDDYSGNTMTSPLIPSNYKKVVDEKVICGKNCIIGTGSTILPGCEIGEGTAVGAMSLISHSTKPWNIYGGIPARILKQRSKNLIEFEKEFERNNE